MPGQLLLAHSKGQGKLQNGVWGQGYSEFRHFGSRSNPG